MRELADITIQFKELEDVVYDEIIEYLEEQKIKYEVINVENQRIEGDNKPDEYDMWKELQW